MCPKICFVTTVPQTLSTFVTPQAQLLLDEGWEVHWASSKLADVEIPQGVVIHELPLTRSPSFLQVVSSTIKLISVFKTEQFVIVQYSSPIAALCASIAGFLTSVKVRIYAQWGIRYVGFNGFRRTLLRALEKFVCTLSTKIQPDSFGNLHFAIDEGLYPFSKGEIVGNGSACGIDLARFDTVDRNSFNQVIRGEFGISSSAFIFGFVGSVRKDKGINELVLSFKKLTQQSQSECALILVGDQEYFSDLNLQVQGYIEEATNIHLSGPVIGVERYLAAFDLLVFPSHREGFGMVVIEAAAMEVPAIVSDIPGPSEAVINGETGAIVELFDLDALMKAMQSYMENTEMVVDQGRAARIRVESLYERTSLMRAFVDNKSELLHQGSCKVS